MDRQTDRPSFENSVEPDQLASSEASWSGSTLFFHKYKESILIMELRHWAGWKSNVDIAFTNKEELNPFKHYASFSFNIDKQSRIRSDAAECGIWSLLQCLLTEYSIKIWRKYKIPPNKPLNRNGQVQMGLVATKPVSRVSDKVRFKSDCSAEETR